VSLTGSSLLSCKPTSSRKCQESTSRMFLQLPSYSTSQSSPWEADSRHAVNKTIILLCKRVPCSQETTSTRKPGLDDRPVRVRFIEGSGTSAGWPLTTSVLFCKYFPTNAPYSYFIPAPPTFIVLEMTMSLNKILACADTHTQTHTHSPPIIHILNQVNLIHIVIS
jgi:hypothetical protein